MTKAWITIVAVSGAGCRSGPDLTVLIAQPTDGTIVTVAGWRHSCSHPGAGSGTAAGNQMVPRP